MSVHSLQEALSSHLEQKNPVASAELQMHFAELILEPTFSDPKIPFELSDALRHCLMENDAINRVYETINRILTLENTPDGMWKEMKSLKREYSDKSPSFRLSKVSDGSTLRACFRVLSYMKAQGIIMDVATFLRETEEQFSLGSVGSHNEFLFLAADLYTDLITYRGGKDELVEMLGIPKSNYVLRAVPEV